MTCAAKHTQYQPTEAEFCCPRCGKPAPDGLCIDTSAGADDCEKLHNDDELHCYACRYTTSGRAFAAAVARKNNLVPCPHCGGRGMVKGGGR